jgi:hypothetical protein
MGLLYAASRQDPCMNICKKKSSKQGIIPLTFLLYMIGTGMRFLIKKLIRKSLAGTNPKTVSYEIGGATS